MKVKWPYDRLDFVFKQIKVRGEAEAFAIAAKAKAEAEQMAKKAEAWREYREAAMVDMLLETLPKVLINKSDSNFKLINFSNQSAGGR